MSRADLITGNTTNAKAIRELAGRVEAQTEGRIRFLYSSRPSTVTYYTFTGAPMEKMTREEVVAWLTKLTNEGSS